MLGVFRGLKRLFDGWAAQALQKDGEPQQQPMPSPQLAPAAASPVGRRPVLRGAIRKRSGARLKARTAAALAYMAATAGQPHASISAWYAAYAGSVTNPQERAPYNTFRVHANRLLLAAQQAAAATAAGEGGASPAAATPPLGDAGSRCCCVEPDGSITWVNPLTGASAGDGPQHLTVLQQRELFVGALEAGVVRHALGCGLSLLPWLVSWDTALVQVAVRCCRAGPVASVQVHVGAAITCSGPGPLCVLPSIWCQGAGEQPGINPMCAIADTHHSSSNSGSQGGQIEESTAAGSSKSRGPTFRQMWSSTPQGSSSSRSRRSSKSSTPSSTNSSSSSDSDEEQQRPLSIPCCSAHTRGGRQAHAHVSGAYTATDFRRIFPEVVGSVCHLVPPLPAATAAASTALFSHLLLAQGSATRDGATTTKSSSSGSSSSNCVGIWLMDGAPQHTAAGSTAAVQKLSAWRGGDVPLYAGLVALQTPPDSRDLNPIEDCWPPFKALLDKRVLEANTEQQLLQQLDALWRSEAMSNKAVACMQQYGMRLQAVQQGGCQRLPGYA